MIGKMRKVLLRKKKKKKEKNMFRNVLGGIYCNTTFLCIIVKNLVEQKLINQTYIYIY